MSRAAPASQRWLTDPVECGSAAGFGVYLHVPFCAHRCGYCDFATQAVDDEDRGALFDRYTDALCTDLRQQALYGPASLPAPRTSPWPQVTSIFIGGGTPTLIGGDRLARIIATVGDVLDVAEDAEITVECNPETASDELFSTLARAGVNRVSMGAQSFVPDVLRTLERNHDAQRPLHAVRQARANGIAQISLDLIYGTPGEDDTDWQTSLDAVLAAGVDHISAYALTIHDNTAFGTAVANNTMPDINEDIQRERFDTARDVLVRGGFDHYEVSNFALGPSRRCLHNLVYWRHGNYLAAGVGAHGHLDGHRWWTTRSTPRYLDQVERGIDAIAGHETLTVEQRATERLLLGLRLRDGLHPMDAPAIDDLALEETYAAGLIEFACGRLRCSDEGWFLLDEAVTRLTA